MAEYVGDDMGEDMGDDMSGEDIGDEYLGAPRRYLPAPRRSSRTPPRAPLPAPRANVVARRVKSYSGIGAFVWTAANTGVIATFEVEPQREFTPTRVIIDVVPSAAGVGGVVNVESITIGDMPQAPASDVPAPAALFRADATESGIRFETIGKGLKLILKLSHTVAVAGADTLSVSCGMYGWMVR